MAKVIKQKGSDLNLKLMMPRLEKLLKKRDPLKTRN